jgi:molybdate transport system substrate-binding protein
MRPLSKAASIFIMLLVFLGMISLQKVSAQEITISAAISLKEAFSEIAKHFEARQKEVRVLFNFGASGDLVRQIMAGAPVDVFASAGLKEMDELEQKGQVVSGSRANFAENTVVLITPQQSSLKIENLSDLTNKEVTRIAVGNPKTVPAGRYADQVLRNLKLYDTVKEKLILAENVRQVLDYVARGEVDAGLVYATDAATKAKELKKIVPVPEGSHQPVVYPIAAVKGGKNESLAKAFVSWVISPEGESILRRHGFKIITNKK